MPTSSLASGYWFLAAAEGCPTQAPKFLNPKSQNTNNKQISMTKIKNLKQCFGH
jgi:hypothetical protein